MIALDSQLIDASANYATATENVFFAVFFGIYLVGVNPQLCRSSFGNQSSWHLKNS